MYPRHHVNSLHLRPSASALSDPGVRFQAPSPTLTKERRAHAPDSMLVYDEVFQQHRRLLSKLDLEEKRRKEARDGGEGGRDIMSRTLQGITDGVIKKTFMFAVTGNND